MVSSLPAELIIMSCRYLNYSEIVNLAWTSRRMMNIVRRNYSTALEETIQIDTLDIDTCKCETEVHTIWANLEIAVIFAYFQLLKIDILQFLQKNWKNNFRTNCSWLCVAANSSRNTDEWVSSKPELEVQGREENPKNSTANSCDSSEDICVTVSTYFLCYLFTFCLHCSFPNLWILSNKISHLGTDPQFANQPFLTWFEYALNHKTYLNVGDNFDPIIDFNLFIRKVYIRRLSIVSSLTLMRLGVILWLILISKRLLMISTSVSAIKLIKINSYWSKNPQLKFFSFRTASKVTDSGILFVSLTRIGRESKFGISTCALLGGWKWRTRNNSRSPHSYKNVGKRNW